MEQFFLAIFEKAGLPAVIILGGGYILFRWGDRFGTFAAELGSRLAVATEANAQAAKSTAEKLDSLSDQLGDGYRELLARLDRAEKSNEEARSEVHAVRLMLERMQAEQSRG